MTQGFAWHVHHDKPVEWVWDYDERLRAIEQKPAVEIPTRKRLFQMVRGSLPAAIVQAWSDYDQTRGVRDRAGDAYFRDQDAYFQAEHACLRARDAYYQALADNMPAILALHAQECTSCPWNGRTIFPEAATAVLA